MEEKETLLSYINVVYRRKALFFSILVLSIIIGIIISVLKRPVFKAEASVKMALESGQVSVLPSSNLAYLTPPVDLVESAMELMKSRTLAQKVVEKLGLFAEWNKPLPHALGFVNVNITSKIKKADYKVYFKNNGFIIKDKKGHVKKGNYNENTEVDGVSFVISKRGDIKGSIKRTLKICPVSYSAELLLKKVIITQKGNSYVVKISVKDHSARKAYRIVNTFADQYVVYASLDQLSKASSIRGFIEQQIEKTGNELLTLEDTFNVEQKRLKTYIPLFNTQDKGENSGVLSILDWIMNEKAKKELKLGRISFEAEALKHELGKKAAVADTVTFSFESSRVEQLWNSIDEKEIAMMQLVRQYGKNSPRVKSISKEIDNLRALLINYGEMQALGHIDTTFVLPTEKDKIVRYILLLSEKNLINKEIERLNTLYNKYQKQLGSLSEKELSLMHISQKINVTRGLYETLLEQLQKARISEEAAKKGSAGVVDYAVVPRKPVSGGIIYNLFVAIVLGFVFAFSAVFVVEILDTTVKTPREIEELVHLPILGVIPYVKGDKTDAIFISHADTHSPYSDAFKKLRTYIRFISQEKELKVFSFTSSVPEEGKTTVSVNFAITVAALGYKTLIIDGDLRKPDLHKKFHINRVPGFVDLFVDHGDMNIRQTDIENLYVLPAGTIPPNASELIASSRLNELIDEFKKGFDFVIFDSAPILPLPDSVELSIKTDSTIVVAKAGYTDREAIVETIETLRKSKVKLAGIVLNGILAEKHYGYYGKYRYKYGYYYGKKKKGFISRLLG